MVVIFIVDLKEHMQCGTGNEIQETWNNDEKAARIKQKRKWKQKTKNKKTWQLGTIKTDETIKKMK